MAQAPYSAQVLDHFARPRNLGRLPEANGRGTVGDLRDGPVQITIAVLIEPDQAGADRIVQARFRAFGCSAAIASASMATVLLEGQTICEATALTPETLAAALGGLPEERRYAPELTTAAVHQALADWERRRTWPVSPLPGSPMRHTQSVGGPDDTQIRPDGEAGAKGLAGEV